MRIPQAGGHPHYAATAGTLVVPGNCVLRMFIPTGGTLTGTVDIYDGIDVTGTLVAHLDANQTVGHGGYPFGMELLTGCTIVTSADLNYTATIEQ